MTSPELPDERANCPPPMMHAYSEPESDECKRRAGWKMACWIENAT